MKEPAITRAGDDYIRQVGENDHAVYYEVGKGVTVSWMAGHQLYCCLRCKKNDCEHTRRLHKWRRELERVDEAF